MKLGTAKDYQPLIARPRASQAAILKPSRSPELKASRSHRKKHASATKPTPREPEQETPITFWLYGGSDELSTSGPFSPLPKK